MTGASSRLATLRCRRRDGIVVQMRRAPLLSLLDPHLRVARQRRLRLTRDVIPNESGRDGDVAVEPDAGLLETAGGNPSRVGCDGVHELALVERDLPAGDLKVVHQDAGEKGRVAPG